MTLHFLVVFLEANRNTVYNKEMISIQNKLGPFLI